MKIASAMESAAEAGMPLVRRAMSRLKGEPQAEHVPPQPVNTESADDGLLELASRMESDGGMPGQDPDARALAAALALFAFLSEGHTPTSGAFRSHVARLVAFLEKLAGLPPERQATVTAAIALARKGTRPEGEWLTVALKPAGGWREVERAVASR